MTTTEKAAVMAAEMKTPGPPEEPLRSEILKQLERIVASPFFRNSKRYPTLFRYVVEHTVAGRTDVLKERTLGTEVFARPDEYDTNADPIVRVTAGEIRKRIAQYYQSPGHEQELRIDLPLGSYVPHFLPGSRAEHEGAELSTHALSLHGSAAEADRYESESSPAASPEPQVEGTTRWTRRKLILSTLAILLISAAAVFAVQGFQSHQREQGMRYFWQPSLASTSPVLIVIGVHSFDQRGDSVPTTGTAADAPPRPTENVLSTLEDMDMVPVSDIVSYSRLTNLITRSSHEYQTKASSDTALPDLVRGPVLLVGGLDNIWTMRLSSALRYRFFHVEASKFGIRDSQHPSTAWLVDFKEPVLNNSRDYAIVASYFDPTVEQRVLIVAGIGKNGTVAASEFLTTDRHMNHWLSQANPHRKNVELVLSTEILDGQPGPPHVLASYSW